MAKATDLVQGTLDVLILQTISLEPEHGWAIARRTQQISRDALQIQQGSLYSALHRLQQQGRIEADWQTTEARHMANFYSMPRAAGEHLDKELGSWIQHASAINHVVQEA